MRSVQVKKFDIKEQLVNNTETSLKLSRLEIVRVYQIPIVKYLGKPSHLKIPVWKL